MIFASSAISKVARKSTSSRKAAVKVLAYKIAYGTSSSGLVYTCPESEGLLWRLLVNEKTHLSSGGKDQFHEEQILHGVLYPSEEPQRL